MKYAEVEKRHLKAGHHKLTGRGTDWKFITVHNTGNPNSTADSERRYLDNQANTSNTAWHIVVDNKQAIEAIPLNQIAYHAGDGRNGTGNMYSIGIEICESGSKAEMNAIELIADLLIKKGLGVECVVPHKHWTGKNCPRLILPHWDRFIKLLEAEIQRQKGANKVRVAQQWELDLIKKVCDQKGMDAELWMGKAMDQVTVSDLFMILNKM